LLVLLAEKENGQETSFLGGHYYRKDPAHLRKGDDALMGLVQRRMIFRLTNPTIFDMEVPWVEVRKGVVDGKDL
jgi:hypothetical protein